MLTLQRGLPGMGVDEKKLSRPRRLELWLKDRGWKLTEDVAQIMGGVHRTFPGKCLMACTDPLPKEQWQRLISAGVPEELLPTPYEQKRFARRDRESSGVNLFAL